MFPVEWIANGKRISSASQHKQLIRFWYVLSTVAVHPGGSSGAIEVDEADVEGAGKNLLYKAGA